MGILRADRVSGLGGANAINGSVFFGNGNQASGITGNNILITEESSDFTFGTGDFTIEGWFYTPDLSNWNLLVGDNVYQSAGGWGLYFNTDPDIDWWKGGSSVVSGATPTVNTWHHVAFSRESGTNRVFLDGALGASASDSTNYTSNQILIGANQLVVSTNVSQWGFKGYASNVRVIKGEAIYTAAFTAPTTRLEKTDNTVLLCCQSPGNILQEETGKILYAVNTPVASNFAPDVGEDHGTTFTDNTKFDTLSYMVPPGGTTAQSNRGRGLIIAGYTNPLNIKTTDYVQIQSLGNAIKFGDATALVRGQDAAGSSTRAVSAGGYVAPGIVDTIEYFTTATTGNATDFGNLLSATSSLAGFGNETRGIWAGGYVPSASDKIDYVTIATTGNAADFGNCVANVTTAAGCASPTRGVFGGGYASPAGNNTLQYVTIATTGNATDFGDLTAVTWGLHALSSNTRGVFGGGVAPSITNTISYVTIATTGNATDFGDLIQTASYHACTSNGSRGIFAGGDPTSTFLNTIQYVTIATTGNASDFGDMTTIRAYGSGTSDSHGGI